MTVGECLIPIEDIIDNTDIFSDAQQCQEYCHGTTTCEVFRFDGKHCTLLTKDYRKDCQISAGGYVSRTSKICKPIRV